MRPGRRAVFLDRDGTLIRDVGYPRDPAAVELLPGAAEALARLRRDGYLLVVVTSAGASAVRSDNVSAIGATACRSASARARFTRSARPRPTARRASARGGPTAWVSAGTLPMP